MNPALTTIQNDVRAAELRATADGQRSPRSKGRSQEIAGQKNKLAPAFGALFLGHGFFGREHGSAA